MRTPHALPALRLVDEAHPVARRPRRAGVTRLGADELVLFERPLPSVPFSAAGEPRGHRFDALRAIHACYAPEPTTRGWLAGVVEPLRAITPTAAWFEWREDGGAASAGTPAVPGRPGPAAIDAVVALIGPECYRALLRPSPVVQLLSHRLRTLPAELERRVAEVLRADGLAEAVLLFGGDVDDEPIVLGMPVPDGVRPPSRTVGLLRHVAGHLNTARALRASLVRVGDAAARSVAPRAVAELISARAFVWLTPAEEAARWRAFLEGGYALVDHWATPDRSRLLVRRCQEAGDPAALRAPEREVLARLADAPSHGALAEQLGIGADGVKLHLGNARARLRCGSRQQLAELLAR